MNNLLTINQLSHLAQGEPDPNRKLALLCLVNTHKRNPNLKGFKVTAEGLVPVTT